MKSGLHIDSNGKLSWSWEPGCIRTAWCWEACPARRCRSPAGCVLGWRFGRRPDRLAGPPFKRMDFSSFRRFRSLKDSRMEFRAEFFNIFNHPNFNAPNFGGNGVVAVSGSGNFTSSNFGEIGSTRDAPYDPRQIQFALKLYF